MKSVSADMGQKRMSKYMKESGNAMGFTRSIKSTALLLAFVLGIGLSRVRADDCPVVWAMYGSINTSTMTPVLVGIPSVVVKSSTTADCYTIGVYPNGVLYTRWVQCPK